MFLVIEEFRRCELASSGLPPTLLLILLLILLPASHLWKSVDLMSSLFVLLGSIICDLLLEFAVVSTGFLVVLI